MFSRKVSLTALILVSTMPHLAFGSQIQAVAQSSDSAPIQDPIADENIDLAFDRLLVALESLPEEMQDLPLNDPLVQAYLQNVMSGNQGEDMPRSWIGLAKCTAHLGIFVATTGVPVGKFIKALKEFKAIAGSWKAMAKMWRTGDWGALGGESIEIIKKLSGIDDVISACSQAF